MCSLSEYCLYFSYGDGANITNDDEKIGHAKENKQISRVEK